MTLFWRLYNMSTSCVPKYLPILKFKVDNNYDVGFKIGSTFGQYFTMNNDSATGKLMRQFYDSEVGKSVFDEYLAKTTECFPNIVEEMRGMASGAGMPFDELFLHNMISEITLTTAWLNQEDSDDEEEVAGCTDVLVNTDQCRLIAHNEDWTTDVSSNAFLIDVEVERITDGLEDQHVECSISEVLQARNERFFSFVFPGCLAGSTFAMNEHFVFTINSLVPQKFNRGSVLLFVLLRALLRCETLEECVQLMECDPYGCSYGININVLSIKTSDMWSIEVYPNKGKTIVDVLHIPKTTGEEGKQYVHTNHYKHIADTEECDILRGSKARETVASKAPIPTCVEDACKILGDRTSKVQPIYRLPSATKNVVTAASAVFDMNAKELHVYLGNPAAEGKLEITVPFF